MANNQYGFRPGQSIIAAMSRVKEIVNAALVGNFTVKIWSGMVKAVIFWFLHFVIVWNLNICQKLKSKTKSFVIENNHVLRGASSVKSLKLHNFLNDFWSKHIIQNQSSWNLDHIFIIIHERTKYWKYL